MATAPVSVRCCLVVAEFQPKSASAIMPDSNLSKRLFPNDTVWGLSETITVRYISIIAVELRTH